jgi:uncharacterized protein
MCKLSCRIVLLAVFACLGTAARAQCNQDCPERRTISVNGSAQVTADADLAIVRVGYKLYAPDAKSAYAGALDTSNAVMAALIGSGVPKSAIESTSQVLQHTQPYELNQYPVDGPAWEHRQFTVTQSWVIRVKPDDAARALNTAIDAGANESGWIQWIVNNPSDLEAQASARAVENAHMIAEQIAGKSNVHLGHLVSVSENQGPMSYGGPIAGAMGQLSGTGGGMGAYDTVTVGNQQLAINSRRVVFNMSVYAVFAIEDGSTPAK